MDDFIFDFSEVEANRQPIEERERPPEGTHRFYMSGIKFDQVRPKMEEDFAPYNRLMIDLTLIFLNDKKKYEHTLWLNFDEKYKAKNLLTLKKLVRALTTKVHSRITLTELESLKTSAGVLKIGYNISKKNGKTYVNVTEWIPKQEEAKPITSDTPFELF